MIQQHYHANPSWIFYWPRRINTTHLIEHWNRDDSTFLHRNEILKILNYDQDLPLYLQAQDIARTIHARQSRRGFFYNKKTWTHATDRNKPYSTHVEWLTELVLFFNEAKDMDTNLSKRVLVIASLFHDVFEDAEYSAQIQMMLDFLKKNLTLDESLQVLRMILALTKPVRHVPELYALLDSNWFSVTVLWHEPEDISQFSKLISEAMLNDVADNLEFMQSAWINWTLSEHRIHFLAPRDDRVARFVLKNKTQETSVPHLLAKHWVPGNIIEQLYRLIQHYLYIDFRNQGWEFREMDTIKKRIVEDLSAIIQVIWFTETAERSPGFSVIKKGVILIKLCDQLYNAWDNYYLLDAEPSSKLKRDLYKARLLAVRATMYEKVLLREIWMNSPLHRIFSHVRENLVWIIANSEKRIRLSE